MQVSSYLQSAAQQHFFIYIFLPSCAPREIIFVKVACSMAREVKACIQPLTVAQMIRYNLPVMANLQSQKCRTCNATTATRHKTTPAHLLQTEHRASKDLTVPTCEQYGVLGSGVLPSLHSYSLLILQSVKQAVQSPEVPRIRGF